ncbi:MAG TPA: membrane glycosyltransferase [Stellaceae bacterium]|nr:membrane glycosyltransferase [Stellaceae bacterium]
MTTTIAIVIPVLDDWPSFAALVADIAHRYARGDVAVHLCAVDDGSIAPFALETLSLPPQSCIVSLDIVRLALNLGHQRAIAVGLCAIADGRDCDAVLVMDGDGEDRPSDIAALLAAGREHPDCVVMAGRAKRSEPLMFRFWYRLYRLLFRLLTGQTISFGNFSLLPMPAVRRLVHMPELWNNLAASIMRSRLPYVTVPTDRGARFAGRSRMNLISLIVHGLSALSVQTDMIFVRVLLAAMAIAGAAALGILGVITIRFGTNLAIPGWATTAAGDLAIILLQTLVVIVAASLTMLAGRSNRPIIPIVDYRPFVAGRERYQLGAPVRAAAATTAATAAATTAAP